MDRELENIINSNVDLSQYYTKYHHDATFLKHYFLQDPNRIIKQRLSVFGFCLTTEDKLELLDGLFKQDLNINAINELLNSLYYSYKRDNSLKDDIDKVITYIEQLGKEGKANPEDFDIYKRITFINDPIGAVIKNPDNVLFLDQVNGEELSEILNICANKGYLFTRKNFDFLVRSGIYNNKELFKYLVNNCRCDSSLINNLDYSILSKEEMFTLYYKYKDEHNIVIDVIIAELNRNAFSMDTIIKDENMYYDCDSYSKVSKEEMLEFFKKIADKNNNFNNLVILVMDRVDMDFVTKAYDILGDKLRISPLANQEVYDENRYNVPTYTYESIKKSEHKLDLYVKTTNDCLDKDGDIKHLSPLEKFLAAYIMVIKFAKYSEEENPNEWNISRSVYDITNHDGDIKIVCAGYVNLLIELLERMGIKDALYWDVRTEDLPFNNHARLLIHLKDEKYDIDGIYMSDPTWDSKWNDNNLPVNSFKYFLMSRPDLIRIDGEKGIKLEWLRADNHSIIHAFNVYNVNELFSKTIGPDVIAKAYLSLSYFLDKNKKMINKDDEYSELDYYATACELNLDRRITYLGKFNYDKMAEEALVMPIGLMKEYYSPKAVAFMLLNVFTEKIESKLAEKFLDSYYSFGYDTEKEEYYIYVEPILQNTNQGKKLSEIYQCDMSGSSPNFRIYNFDNRPIVEQVDDIIKACEKFDEIYGEIIYGEVTSK